MARQTTNYGFNISEGTDLVNPLTDIFPNFEDIDTNLKSVSDRAVGTATELVTGTVHALVRSDSDRNVFTFTATSNFEAGETFTLDGVQVTALTPDGQTLSTGCYIIGSEVLVAVKGTLMTVYVNPSKALDSDKLDGHDSTYYATASDVSDLSGNVSALSSKVGIGTLTVGNDCVDGINTLNGCLTPGLGKYSSTGDPNLLLEFSEMSRNRIFANANLRIIHKVALSANNTYVLGSVYPRPKYRVPLVIVCSNGTSHIGEIATNGIIYIVTSSVTPANGSFSFNVNYLANEKDAFLY